VLLIWDCTKLSNLVSQPSKTCLNERNETFISSLLVSYAILAPALAKENEDPKKASAAILDFSTLNVDLFRLGHTKVPEHEFLLDLFSLSLTQRIDLFASVLLLWRVLCVFSFTLSIFIKE